MLDGSLQATPSITNSLVKTGLSKLLQVVDPQNNVMKWGVGPRVIFHEGGKVGRSNATPIIFFPVTATFLENFGYVYLVWYMFWIFCCRCLNLIEEKDEELSALKNKLDNHSDDYMEDLTKVEETKLDTLVLHYSEEMSKNQLELRELRCKKMELESALHELQMSALSKVNTYPL